MFKRIQATATILLASSTIALAGAGHGTDARIGEPAETAAADRTIEVEMGEMFYTPDHVDIRPGETVRFEITNTGRMLHEFNIGTEAMHEAHAGEMRKMMQSGMMSAHRVNAERMADSGTAHDDPNSLLLEPGETGSLTWTFPGHGPIQIACNVPGHREAGMKAELTLSGGEG